MREILMALDDKKTHPIECTIQGIKRERSIISTKADGGASLGAVPRVSRLDLRLYKTFL